MSEIFRPEILAPVGKTENLYAAIEAGADSVYLGYQKFNARGKASNFNISELYSIRKMLKKNKKKMFMVLNTIIKDKELPELYNFLQIVEDIAPDGLIIQDLGLLNLIQHKTGIMRKGIELHASTQMSTFNSESINTLKDLGFSRVVLDRHVTLEEIKVIKANTDIELEVFVHGAMCYSLSGSCYFSSYLGGLSANRGLCAQVCRRNFSFDSKTESGIIKNDKKIIKNGRKKANKNSCASQSEKGYIYSLSDMDTLEVLDKIVATGVDALKIEGRMKSPDYVYTVTKAYKHLVDNIENFDEAFEEAKEIMQGVVSREKTTGFYMTAAPEKIIQPFSSGVYGNVIGHVVSQKGNTVKVKLFKDLDAKSRVRLHHPKKDYTSTIKVKRVFIKGQDYDRAFVNDIIELNITNEKVYERNNPLYLISNAPMAKWPTKIRPLVKAPQLDIRKYRQIPAKDKRHAPLYYLKLKSYKYLNSFNGLSNKLFILEINDLNIRFLKKYDYRRVYFAIPPTIFEKDLDDIKARIDYLIDNGVTKFEISSISHLGLLKDLKSGDFISGSQLNLINREAVNFFKMKYFKGSVLSVEVSRGLLRSIAKSSMLENTIVPIYGKIRLFVSRAPHSYLKAKDVVYSSRNEKFLFKRENGVSETFSDKDYSITKKLDELKDLGYNKFYVNLSRSNLDKKFIADLIKSINTAKGMKNTSQFNYFLNLK